MGPRLGFTLVFEITACQCDSDGSTTMQCDSEGICKCAIGFIGEKCGECNIGYSGDKCDTCRAGYYGYPDCKGIFEASYDLFTYTK